MLLNPDLLPKNNTIVRTVCSEGDAKSTNSPRSSISSCNSSKVKILPSSTKNILFCEQMLFKSEKDWFENIECNVCFQPFNKLKAVFRHHCRICGMSCCGDCSLKKVNDERVCDICYLRVMNQDLIERKKGILALKDQLLEEMFSELNGLALKNQELDLLIQESRQMIKEDQKNYVQKMASLREELRTKGDTYKEKLDGYKNLRESIRKEREILSEKEKGQAEANKKSKILKDEFKSKERSYKNKASELSDYMKIFGKIKNCESFHRLKISVDEMMILEGLRSNSKEHSSFLLSAEKKKRISNMSKFSSHKDMRGNSQMSQGSGIFYMPKTSLKDYKDNSLHSSVAGKSMALNFKDFSNSAEEIKDRAGGACFCAHTKCRIF